MVGTSFHSKRCFCVLAGKRISKIYIWIVISFKWSSSRINFLTSRRPAPLATNKWKSFLNPLSKKMILYMKEIVTSFCFFFALFPENTINIFENLFSIKSNASHTYFIRITIISANSPKHFQVICNISISFEGSFEIKSLVKHLGIRVSFFYQKLLLDFFFYRLL